ncbi:MAG: HoxN/HupN/NixA family nickel/cobalt transporter [Thaumarchaeota archaeon]|nr:HoxN/HupN/NixA family nickel/cobalt transporter [Nitrososphaerota archaeon]
MPLGLSREEALRVVALYAALGVVTFAGFFASSVVGRSYVLLAGLGLVAYVFGLRHGLDADHIAAIDNTTRKLMRDGQRPTTVGFWFSLGHSTVVVALIVALVYSTRAAVGAIPALQAMGDVAGTAISGVFLWIMGAINVVIVLEIYRIFRALRTGEMDEARLEAALSNRGFMNRYFGRMFRIVERPWQIYPIGVLFGLGFDTASEVALIAISVGVGVTSAVPIWMVLVLPLMFTCGMVLVDTSDALLMTMAYSWAFLKPIRKVYYNLTITFISVLVAFLIGGVELLQVFSNELRLTGGAWQWLAGIDFETMGLGVVCIFLVSWAAAIIVYRFKNFEKAIPVLDGRS